MFLSVTHLIIHREYANPDNEGWQQWSHLGSLPALTHLCFSENISSFILSHVLSHCARLHVFVTIWITMWYAHGRQTAEAFSEALTITDSRVVLMVVADYNADWEVGTQGGDDFWARADEFVARKQRGEIKTTCYFLDDTDDNDVDHPL
ncbi:hypothetical protein B0H10DRAFT_2227459 [Mycena sp. CBHHK59/15]|nr:hypothetical protein B0H10DRAFT_2240738 [Mycena sp. CBHHK59/15]KAJ6607815.1 hypothetical protein B0H10DRAFT_2227459 [Mycena sp. CBHHK59/15]